jgi:hypothetical protein
MTEQALMKCVNVNINENFLSLSWMLYEFNIGYEKKDIFAQQYNAFINMPISFKT